MAAYVMATPMRVQLSRRKGFDLQATSRALNGLPAKVVARPTRYGNPYVVTPQGPYNAYVTNLREGLTIGGFGPLGAAVKAVELYSRLLERDGVRRRAARDLRGFNLACWCKLCPAHAAGKPFGVECSDCAPCHADVLGQLANAEPCP